MAVLGSVPRPPTSQDIFIQLFQPGSRNLPPCGKSAHVELYISQCQADIKALKPKPIKQSNLSESEFVALKSLQQRSDIVIKPADKGGAVVVWDRGMYIQEANRQLHNTTAYQSLTEPTLLSDKKLIAQTIKTAVTQNKLPPTAKHLNKSQVQQPKLYLLPKIHKPDSPGRPIVSACSCPTEHLSQYLDHLLQPIVQTLPSYIKDTTHALHLLGEINNNPSFHPNLLFTMDVCSLYTSIPHSDGLQALQFFLDNRSVRDPPTPILLRLAELVLTLNTFEFDGQVFHQISGVAMGTKMGPSYACLFMGHLESQIRSTYTGPQPELCKRYIDDCLGATSLSLSDLTDYIHFVSNYHPSIKFTFDISPSAVAFLDLNISLSDSILSTSVHYKDTDAHTYLTFHSSHPSSTIRSIPFSQFLRLRRICSDTDDFEEKAAEMSDFFLQPAISSMPYPVSNAPKYSTLVRPKEPSLPASPNIWQIFGIAAVGLLPNISTAATTPPWMHV
ncbi:uncharacterized protein [Littorina saxatilis]|uniref:uncharacterized protein n=2 Tax=Littorina saxatilis TaxID=31220 RepID=UPI0038B60A55